MKLLTWTETSEGLSFASEPKFLKPVYYIKVMPIKSWTGLKVLYNSETTAFRGLETACSFFEKCRNTEFSRALPTNYARAFEIFTKCSLATRNLLRGRDQKSP